MPDPTWLKSITAREQAATPVVCLCGSTRFMEAFFVAGWEMTLRGIIVLSVGVCKHADADGAHGAEALGGDVADRLDELHKRKIDLAHAVLVLNIGGYIGDSTRSEIEYAEAHGVPVAYLESCEPAPTEWDGFAWDELAEGVKRAAHSRTDIPLLRDMLRFVAETLEYIAGPVGEVSAKDAAREALAAYRSGVLPKGEPHA